MPNSWIAPATRPCLWMAAGLINYKLCDRDFDCEHCPLDAALRGDSRPVGPEGSHIKGRPPASLFPSDRRYSTGHSWIQLADDGATRLGLDAFAAGMLDGLVEIHSPATGDADRDMAIELRLDSGSISLGLPIEADSTRVNPLLVDEPDLALTAPYGDGWLATLTGVEPSEMDALLSAEQALEQARQDLRLFRRRVALEMLADTRDLGHCMADGGEPLTDVRRMVGAPRFNLLLQELIH